MDSKLSQTIKTIIISVISCIMVLIIAAGIFMGLVVSSATKNIKVEEAEATRIATSEIENYVRDVLKYTDMPLESINLIRAEKELHMGIPFKQCHYTYEYEFIAGTTEIDVYVNAKTGECSRPRPDID